MKASVLTVFIFLSCFTGSLQAQLQYLGLKSEGNVRSAQLDLAGAGAYWPKTQVLDGYLYIPTIKGLYRKSLTTLNDTIWEPYAFANIPIKDFVRKNDSILAITALIEDSLVLLSTDYGTTFTNHTSSHFFDYENYNAMWNLDQNRLNANSIIITHAHYGISKSIDFGNTWTSLSLFGGGYQDWFVGFHPLDTLSIYYTGELMFFDSFIHVSNDNGANWLLTGNVPNHCTHTLAFHPVDTNIVISGGEGFIGKSFDRGITWTYTDTLPMYIYDIKYDLNDNNILYAVGDYHGTNDTIVVYRSTNGGDHWEEFYSETIPDSDGTLELHIIGNKLLLYTIQNGVFVLDMESVEIPSIEKETDRLEVGPNPVIDQLNWKSEDQIERLIIYDSVNKEVYLSNPNSLEGSIDCRFLQCGIYFVSFTIEDETFSFRIIKI